MEKRLRMHKTKGVFEIIKDGEDERHDLAENRDSVING